MAESTEKGLMITPKSISTTLGVIALGSALFTGISVVNSYSYRLDRLESDKVELTSSITQLTNKIDTLNTKLVDLTIALNRVQDRYRSRGETEAK